jgi:osmotically-inducible protein OsmY
MPTHPAARLVAAALVIFLLTPLLVAQATASQDDRIYDDVRRKLANDADVKGGAFDVTVKNGVVTLKGRVHTEKAKEKATRLTKKIKGVTGVNNELKMFDAE